MTQHKLLLVVDSPITRRLVRHGIERSGFVVSEAPDGATALRLAREWGPDLILVDLALTESDSYTLVHKLRDACGERRCALLAISGLLTHAEEARLSVAGFDGVITKPIEPSRLAHLLHAYFAEDSSIASPFGEGRRVLVADDDPLQLKLASLRLARAGFQVTTARDGAEALALAREVRPDVVVADVMMPRLDGFALCQRLRDDRDLQQIPVVLMTNSYLADADRELASRLGASEFVLRTPRFDEVLRAVRRVLGSTPVPAARTTDLPAETEEERSRRIVHQLERQITINAGLSQRIASLSAELSVLAGIAEALATDFNTDAALETVLAACFDAGGISRGVLYVAGPDGRLGARSFGVRPELAVATALSEHEDLVRQVIAGRRTASLPGEGLPEEVVRRVLAAGEAGSAVIVPLVQGELGLGALLLLSESLALQEPDRLSFAEGVAHQIGLALALASSFKQKDASERGAREQAALLRSILESLPDGVAVVDASGTFTLWNAAAEQGLGLAPRQGPLESWPQAYGLYRPDGQAHYDWEELPLARALRGEAVDAAEIYMRREGSPEGTWLSVTARPHLFEDGTRGGAVAVFRDVTAQRKTQAQLIVTDRLASVGMLAAGVAHEINNPLAAVMANLDLALGSVSGVSASSLDDQAVQQLEEDLRSAREAAGRVRDIVRDLTVFSRGDDQTTGPVDLQLVVDASLRMARNEIRHRARLVRDYQDRLPPVNGNEARLGQVFLNLIVNAAQAIPEGHADENEIKVSIARGPKPRTVVVKITDTGSGMPPEVLERVFMPFFTTKPMGVGTGLGLSICHRIVTSVGGSISIESTPGRGTTVTVELASARGSSGERAAVSSKAVATRRGHVLVVDDEPAVREAVRRALSGSHEVVTVAAASDVLERINAGIRYDVIVCDLMMPVMTGRELHDALLAVAPDQASRMVFLTGGAFTPEALAFLRTVAQPQLEKPFDLQTLRAIVDGFIR